MSEETKLVESIEAVGVLIVRGGRLLLEQRPEGTVCPFEWELPVDDVKGGESHQDAVTRLLRERLDLKAGDLPYDAVWSYGFASCSPMDPRPIAIHFYPAPKFRGTPAAQKGRGLGWFTEREFTEMVNGGMLAPATLRASTSIAGAAFRPTGWSWPS